MAIMAKSGFWKMSFRCRVCNPVPGIRYLNSPYKCDGWLDRLSCPHATELEKTCYFESQTATLLLSGTTAIRKLKQKELQASCYITVLSIMHCLVVRRLNTFGVAI